MERINIKKKNKKKTAQKSYKKKYHYKQKMFILTLDQKCININKWLFIIISAQLISKPIFFYFCFFLLLLLSVNSRPTKTAKTRPPFRRSVTHIGPDALTIYKLERSTPALLSLFFFYVRQCLFYNSCIHTHHYSICIYGFK